MAEHLDAFRGSPRQIRKAMARVLEAGLVPYVKGSPGIGKSSLVADIGDEYHVEMRDHRLSTSEPTDLSGLPHFEGGFAKFSPFQELFPIAGTALPQGKQGWIVFLDEFNHANKQVQAASYKLILDRMVGQYKLHENVFLVLAGNLDSDRANTNSISTALQSRVVHLEMEIKHHELEWIDDVALKYDIDHRIISYIRQNPSKLMDFRPDHNDNTFCCPRTWEFMSRLIKGREVLEEDAMIYAGTITSGVAMEFIQYTKIYKTLVTIKDILADPEGCHIPSDSPSKWATICHMMEKITKENFDKLATYANRFSSDFRILFYRSVMVRNPKLRSHPAFAQAMIELNHYLHD